MTDYSTNEKMIIIQYAIKKYENEGGIEKEKLIINLNEPSHVVNQEIQKLLEDGTIFEPRPGIFRWLG